MMYYGIVKRQRKLFNVAFFEKIKLNILHNKFSDWGDIINSSRAIDYEHCVVSYDGVIFDNAILEVIEKDEEVIEWQGKFHGSPLNSNESITINDEVMYINRVEKSVDNTVTYFVNDLVIKDKGYETLLGHYKHNLNMIFESKKPMLNWK